MTRIVNKDDIDSLNDFCDVLAMARLKYPAKKKSSLRKDSDIGGRKLGNRNSSLRRKYSKMSLFS